MSRVDEQYIRLYVDESLMNCALLAFTESGFMSTILNSQMQALLNLDDRMDINISFPYPINYGHITMKDDLNISLSLDLKFIQKQAIPAELYITMPFNITVAVGHVDITKTRRIVAQVDEMAIDSFHVSYFSPNIPQDYQTQIKNTNFNDLTSTADKYLKKVLPSLNANLKNGIPISEVFNVTAVKYVNHPEFKLVRDNSTAFFFLGFNIKN